MKTLVIANQKGGVGKTATVVHLAFDAQERGLRTVVIDLDTQANATFTLRSAAAPGQASRFFTSSPALPEPGSFTLIAADAALADQEKIQLSQAAAHFRASIVALRSQGYDLCLIDTAPSLGNAMAAALLSADFVVSPIELEAYSIQGIKKMVTTIVNLRSANPSLQFLGMIPSKVDSRNPRHKTHLAELQAAYPGLLLPRAVGLRSSIADALASRVPVWKIRKTAARAAAKEVRSLNEFVFNAMKMEL